MIRHATGEGERGFHRIETVHFRRVRLVGVGFALRLAAIEERSDRTLIVGSGEVAVERENPVRLGEIGHQLHAVAQCDIRRVAGEGFVLIELRVVKFRSKLLGQTGAGRAVISAKQESDF